MLPDASPLFETAPSGGDGVVLAVVGPSGAGKDSLIAYARQRLASDPLILFVRRMVTREAVASAEDHDTCSPEAFASARAAGAFAVDWEAHGLHYGIPVAVHGHLQKGGIVVVNGSRAALPAMRSVFRRVIAVHITCHPEILAARLASRRRETAHDVQLRLQRASLKPADLGDMIEIDNSGELAVAGEALTAAIRRAASLARYRRG
ncbi:phosphonate metabolism protein/1,5-bisphosphokinase (PRPP-forming) PhnN [Rhodoligotrophos ferricapiens]|uniref:phosphonate metabolism protein/1,5-bisphosphokinase (PRPP-forming) PhnN n=1 Tax=Rhodoligotrophos ferricapiens TaxID=3069264 RepID=UPI00315CA31E